MENAADYTLIKSLGELVEPAGNESIVSRTFVRADGFKAILFGFDAGQELSEHTASVPAILQIVAGEATATLGDDVHELSAGAWAYMPSHLKHSVLARTPVKMLLLMLG